jgi:hypothetical protein
MAHCRNIAFLPTCLFTGHKLFKDTLNQPYQAIVLGIKAFDEHRNNFSEYFWQNVAAVNPH